MATTRQQIRAREGAGPDGTTVGEWDEALLLEQTGGMLTALPHGSSADEWDMPALICALRRGEVRLPLTRDEEQRFRHPEGSGAV
jgi:hypothetical protein